LSGNIKTGFNEIPSSDELNVYVKAKPIVIKETEISNNSGEAVTNGFSITLPIGDTYPNNGKIGLNPNVNVNVGDFTVNNIPIVISNKPSSVLQLNLDKETGTIQENTFTLTGKSIANAIDFAATCSVWGYKNELSTKVEIKEDDITINEVPCDVTLPKDNPLAVDDINVKLGKEISYYLPENIYWSDTNFLKLTPTTENPLIVDMNGLNISTESSSYTITYTNKINGVIIAQKDFTIKWEGEIEEVIDDLGKCDEPYHCPHGRPTLICISEKQLIKEFKRG
jgi:hypothetical protein